MAWFFFVGIFLVIFGIWQANKKGRLSLIVCPISIILGMVLISIANWIIGLIGIIIFSFMVIIRYFLIGGFEIEKYRKKGYLEESLDNFIKNNQTKKILDEYNFEPEKLKNIIKKSYYSGQINIIFILKKEKILRNVLGLYTKAPSDWNEEDKFIESSLFLNQYNID